MLQGQGTGVPIGGTPFCCFSEDAVRFEIGHVECDVGVKCAILVPPVMPVGDGMEAGVSAKEMGLDKTMGTLCCVIQLLRGEPLCLCIVYGWCVSVVGICISIPDMHPPLQGSMVPLRGADRSHPWLVQSICE